MPSLVLYHRILPQRSEVTPPAVSFVISVYNGEVVVRKSLDSVLAQCFQDLEVIVVDDGSTDQTARVLRDYQQRDSRIRPIFQENKGLTRALITGCDAAQGEFIARQDADDWSHPDRLQQQVQLLNSDAGIGFVSCWTRYVAPGGELLDTITRPDDSELATRRLLHEFLGPPAHGSVMFRKSLYQQVGGYRAPFYFGQDSDLWLRLAEMSRIAYCQEALYTAQMDVTGISAGNRQVQRQFGLLSHACREARASGIPEDAFLAEAEELADNIRSRNDRPLNRKAAAASRYLIGSQLARRRSPVARKYLWETICHQPWHWKAWIKLAQSLMRHQSPDAGRNRDE